MKQGTKREAGFTLIEVMIVVVIVAVLGAIAMPAYNDYILRSRLAEAYANLGDMATKLEQFYQDNRTYQGACAANTVAPLPPPQPPNVAPGQLKYFTITCPAGNLTANTFLVQADGVGTTAGFQFKIDNTGLKQTTGVPAGTGYNTSNNCWVRRKGAGAAAC